MGFGNEIEQVKLKNLDGNTFEVCRLCAEINCEFTRICCNVKDKKLRGNEWLEAK
jgi:hypothetical protein